MILPVAIEAAYRTPVPGNRYWARGQGRLLSAAGGRRLPYFPRISVRGNSL